MLKGLINWLQTGNFSGQPSKTNGCLSCGKCCEAFGGHLQASKADLQRWKNLERQDLLKRVNRLGWIWTDPETGRHYDRCPFLKQVDEKTAHCGIHEVKPDICKAYPTLAHNRCCMRGIHFPEYRLSILLAPAMDFFSAWIPTQSLNMLNFIP